MNLLLVFDSHPVQYRAPLWRQINSIEPKSLHVVYASDCSVKGHADSGFGQTFAWDDPMLSGYESTVLNCENGVALSGWNSLSGKGIAEALATLKPSTVLLTGLNYRFDLIALFEAKRKGIPVWLRCETQDYAIKRSKIKSYVRGLIYAIAYKFFDKIFYIGELNRLHYLKHGVPPEKLYPALYGTVNRYQGLSIEEKLSRRDSTRKKAAISQSKFVIGFSGKFIDKKNPAILFDMLKRIDENLLAGIVLYFVGSGELEPVLKEKAAEAFDDFRVSTFFSGFVNQSEIGNHYLAMDILVLPSRKMGETWGLVVNEAMQAGCGVVASNVVGSSENFKDFPRFRVFKDDDPQDLANQVTSLSLFPRSLNWADELLIPYSIDTSSESIFNQLAQS
ncbi:MAG: glycosyltransferase family 4 protein [Bacteroidota bacterium]